MSNSERSKSEKAQSEKDLIKNLLAGDEATFESTFNQYYSLMFSVAQSIAGSSIADEVIQEAWISALRALPKFEGRSSLKSWLMRIVANEAKTRRRKESRSVSLESMQESWATDPRFDEKSHWVNPSSQWHGDTPEDLLLAKELQDCISKNLEKLPENQRAALQMRDAAGLSMDELCNILDVSPSNVRVLLHRARDKVLQVIDHFELTGEC
ncbi:RNA polymerase sigma factor [Aliikangiella coralliicola]|uniref:RNA polymerase sigma factor n=1 Tax=Aliikangiella coralliicola TaxID=2592383 RepID=A0A545UI59_9GAMM|nr:RNA polymerase sigma factor [Aliikangiella coralliicola]TQV89154.1 RNA polymerase sigma factor [Aliikangiella coralliicola]